MKNILIIAQKVDTKSDVLGPFVQWIREFSRQADKVTVITQFEGTYELPEKVKVISLGKEKGNSLLVQMLRFYIFTFRYRKEYDNVFIHMIPHYAILGLPLFFPLKKRVYLWYTHKSTSLPLKVGSLFVKNIFTASKMSCRLRSKKVIVSGHGIDTNLFRPSKSKKDKKIRIVTASRISPIKNIHLMIEAIRRLGNKKVVLEIYGEPALESDKDYLLSLKKKVEEEGLKTQIRFKGSVSNEELPRVYSHYDIFINLSNTGSIDKAVLEAMSSDLKILTSNEAFKEILREDNFTSNDPETIRAKLDYLIKTKQKSYRDLIIREHSLSRLIRLILDWMK